MTPARAEAIVIRDLTRRFGETVALNGVSLSIREGEFFSLLGPSGCGKTTLLRLIAGLDVADSGVIEIDGVEQTDVPAYRRPVNTVFQSYALFPHLDVWNNIAFGLRMKKVDSAAISRKVEAVMDVVQIGDLRARRPNQLSGGQRQRVALARAIVNEPKVLLLDEPLAALDLKLRKQLQTELRSLQRRLGITFVYVTHDQEEALVLSDRIAVMRGGSIEQLGPPHEVYEKPRNRFVGHFVGACNILEGEGQGHFVDTALGRMKLGSPSERSGRLVLAIRPEKVQLFSGRPSSAENLLSAVVVEMVYVGAETHYTLRAGEQTLRAELMNSPESEALFVGQKAWLRLPPAALVVLDE